MAKLDVKFTLVSEGQSEEPLVAHLEQLCVRAGAEEAAGFWFDFRRLRRPPGKNLANQLDCVLGFMHDLDVIFIHRDADDRDGAMARSVIARDVAAVTQAHVDHVAVIPVQALEAWLLVDHQAIRRVVGNPGGKADLGLPPLAGLERLADPKTALKDAIDRAAEQTGRRRHDLLHGFGRLRRTLLERLDLDGPVRQLSSWAALVTDIERCISRLRSQPRRR